MNADPQDVGAARIDGVGHNEIERQVMQAYENGGEREHAPVAKT